MKSYLQGFITGSVFISSFFIFIGSNSPQLNTIENEIIKTREILIHVCQKFEDTFLRLRCRGDRRPAGVGEASGRSSFYDSCHHTATQFGARIVSWGVVGGARVVPCCFVETESYKGD